VAPAPAGQFDVEGAVFGAVFGDVLAGFSAVVNRLDETAVSAVGLVVGVGDAVPFSAQPFVERRRANPVVGPGAMPEEEVEVDNAALLEFHSPEPGHAAVVAADALEPVLEASVAVLFGAIVAEGESYEYRGAQLLGVDFGEKAGEPSAAGG